MKHVYLLVDADKNVVAIYDSEELATKMKSAIEQKLQKQLNIEKRTVNLDLKTIGVFK